MRLPEKALAGKRLPGEGSADGELSTWPRRPAKPPHVNGEVARLRQQA